MNKRVALITRHAIVNYGSFLQTFATQEIFKNLGYDITIIDYIREDENYKNVTELLLTKSKRWNKNAFFRMIYRIIQWPDHYICGKAFENIRKKWLKLTPRFTNSEEITSNIIKADVFCTGSDQVWGEIGSDEIDSTYFLDFPAASNKNKFSFSASFGKDNYSIERIKKFRYYLSDYSRITVRELSALNIIKQANLNAETILDPTLIYGAKNWGKVIPEINKKDYVLLYQLNNNKDMDYYAINFAKKAKIPLLRISVELHNIFRAGKFIWCLSPFKFLSYIKNAKYVITDSFHGTAFSIMFNTDFIEFLPKEKSTRNISLLNQFGLENRIISDLNDYSFINEKIDFDIINKSLKKAQNNSEKILKNTLQEVAFDGN